MGMDISYHPVDESIFSQRIVPYLLGKGNLDDLIPAALRIAKVRFRANAWGLGITDIEHKQFQPPPPPPPSFFAKLFGKKAPPPPPPSPPKIPLGDFSSDIHVWGRPFFITAKSPADVSRAIDRYLQLSPDQVDAYAQEMLRTLSPTLPGQVQPSPEGTLPDDTELANGVTWKLKLLRQACANFHSGKTVQGPDGEPHEPASLLQNDLILACFEFASIFRPGWMDRGYVWPTHLFEETGLPIDLFESPHALFQPLIDAGLDLGDRSVGIEENYMVGGYVRAENVPALRAIVEENRDRLSHVKFRGQLEDISESHRKFHEALLDAESRGIGFAEATEIYSAPLGVMN